MKNRKEFAVKAMGDGLKQFTCNEFPCAKCGCVIFFTAGGGRCKDCLYSFTRAKRSTVEGKESERISRKKSYEKHYSIPGNRKKKSQKDKEYIKRLKEDPVSRELFLEKKRNIYRKWYYSDKGNKKAIQNVKRWNEDNPHYLLLRKALERMNVKVGSVLSDAGIDSVLGYSKDDFINHISATMQPGMSFSNRNEWHIDHILPVNWFVKNNLIYPELVNCLHNIKAELAEYNLKKNNKWINKDVTEWEWCYMLQWMVYGEIRYKEGG